MTGNERAYHEFLTAERQLDRPFHFLFFFSSCYGVIFDPENVLPFLRGTVSAGNQQTIADR